MSGPSAPYPRRYAPGRAADESRPGTRIGRPRPGHGTVYVRRLTDAIWWGSWQDDFPVPDAEGRVAGVADIEGSKEDVLRWARSRPAARFLEFDPETDDYRPLSGDERT
jgi:hypothetical protein